MVAVLLIMEIGWFGCKYYDSRGHKEVCMGIEYRKLSMKELDVFIDMRINQLREEGADEDIDLKPALRDYYERHMADGTPNGKIHVLSNHGKTILRRDCIWRA